jgi:hypothetical protein
LTNLLQSNCATGRTPDDGWIAIRDPQGHLWCEYHPGRQVVRNYCKIDGTRYYGEISIDDLINGTYTATRTKRP